MSKMKVKKKSMTMTLQEFMDNSYESTKRLFRKFEEDNAFKTDFIHQIESIHLNK